MKLLSISEAAKELRCSPRVIVALGAEGVLDVVGRKVTAKSVDREVRRGADHPNIERSTFPADVHLSED
jgi:hypothetical protein